MNWNLEPSQPRFTPSILGPLELVTAPTILPVTPEEAKAHCRSSCDDDILLQRLMIAATQFCETEIDGHRQFMTAVYDLPVECWWEGPLKIPRPPLQSVGSVKYYDANGTLQTLATTEYLTRIPWRQPGTIERAPNKTWPSYQADRRMPIVIRFTAGWATQLLVPGPIKQAILMLVDHWYEQPSAVMIGSISKEVEFSVRSLLDSVGYGSYA